MTAGGGARAWSALARRASARMVIVVWALVTLALVPLQPRLQGLAADESDAFEAASAESSRVDDALGARFPEGGDTVSVIAYSRAGGLTPADELRIDADAKAICASREIHDLVRVVTTGDLPCGSRPENTATGGVTSVSRSDDQTTLLTVVQTRDDATDVVSRDVAAIRSVAHSTGGLRVWVTGEGAFAADQSAAFEGIDSTLLLVTVGLIAVLLLAIYRSARLVLVPLIVVGCAYVVASALVYALARLGLRVTGQATAILVVLMFGTGTDYCLLLIARYREAGAMGPALRRTAPTIVTAASIVAVAMLALSLASYNATRWMGPVLAVGMLVIAVACLTLLPALLVVVGAGRGRAVSSVWPRIGGLVRRRPRVLLAVTLALLLAGTAGNLRRQGVLDFTQQFRQPPESVRGLEHLRNVFGPGQAGPTQVLADTGETGALLPALRAIPGVAGSDAVRFSLADQRETQIDVVLEHDPFGEDAAALIAPIRAVARRHGATVGGATAAMVDTRAAQHADARLIVPVVLALVFLLVAGLLRAVVAPLYVVATVLLSYGFALGVSALLFAERDPAQPLFAFVFLVALGVDYNVFLLARMREARGDAAVEALVRTGGVITSAGLILAGTFCTLLATELFSLFQVGVTVALGLLVDTFLVRVFLVPSIAVVLGRWSWWPSR